MRDKIWISELNELDEVRAGFDRHSLAVMIMLPRPFYSPSELLSHEVIDRLAVADLVIAA